MRLAGYDAFLLVAAPLYADLKQWRKISTISKSHLLLLTVPYLRFYKDHTPPAHTKQLDHFVHVARAPVPLISRCVDRDLFARDSFLFVHGRVREEAKQNATENERRE